MSPTSTVRLVVYEVRSYEDFHSVTYLKWKESPYISNEKRNKFQTSDVEDKNERFVHYVNWINKFYIHFPLEKETMTKLQN